MTANINSMMYVGEKPWHGLGTKVEQAATSAEAISAAGLGWKVSPEPLFLNDRKEIVSHVANVRQDTGEVLGVVGNRYHILQNNDAFKFFDAIVGVKEAMYHTAGSLGAGQKVWLLAKLPGYIHTIGDDVTEKFLLLSNSHDGSSAVQIMFTPIRVVCQNTLNIALSSKIDTRAKVRHTVSMGMRIDEVRQTLGIINQKFSQFEELSQQLAVTQLTREAFKSYVEHSGLVPVADEKSTRAQNIIDEVSQLFERGKGTEIPGVRGSAWGAFNAVVEYVDHVRTKNPEKKAESLLFGSGAVIKQKAWDNALALTR